MRESIVDEMREREYQRKVQRHKDTNGSPGGSFGGSQQAAYERQVQRGETPEQTRHRHHLQEFEASKPAPEARTVTPETVADAEDEDAKFSRKVATMTQSVMQELRQKGYNLDFRRADGRQVSHYDAALTIKPNAERARERMVARLQGGEK